MKRIAHAEETARRGKKDVDDRVDVDEEEGEGKGRKFERALRERKHRWEQSGQHLERVSVLRPTAAPVFLGLLLLSLSLEHAHAHACVVRETDPAWKDREPKIRRGRNGHVRVLLERRKKEEEEEEGECVRERESGKTRGFYRWMEYGCWMVDDDDRSDGRNA